MREDQTAPSDTSTIWWALGVVMVLIIGIGIYEFSRQMSNPPNYAPVGIIATSTTQVSNNISIAPEIKSFTIETKNFSFSPNQITVNKGDTVKIIIKNLEGTHDFVLDEFGIKTNVITGPGTTDVQFVANKTGQFQYYCSVGTHRQMGMVGTLMVN